jgi:hypothetical protein
LTAQVGDKDFEHGGLGSLGRALGDDVIELVGDSSGRDRVGGGRRVCCWVAGECSYKCAKRASRR